MNSNHYVMFFNSTAKIRLLLLPPNNPCEFFERKHVPSKKRVCQKANYNLQKLSLLPVVDVIDSSVIMRLTLYLKDSHHTPRAKPFGIHDVEMTKPEIAAYFRKRQWKQPFVPPGDSARSA
jgi:hypothetical protein